MVLLIANELELLLELLSLGKTLYDKGFTILVWKLSILWQLDREGGLQDKYRAYRKFKHQVDLGGGRCTMFRLSFKHRLAVLISFTRWPETDEHVKRGFEQAFTIFELFILVEKIECLNDRFLDQIEVFCILMASHKNPQWLRTFAFEECNLRKD